MDREQMKLLLGQRLSVGFDGYEIADDFRELVRNYKVGNVILFRRNIKDYDQLRRLTADLTRLIVEETGLPPFIMLDEEGGSVSRLSHIAMAAPSALAVGSTGDTENARTVGRMIGEELRSVGINFNLAPVLDCMVNPRNQSIGTRSFGTVPERVAEMGTAYMQGIQSNGVIACAKHFPGGGDTKSDTHVSLSIIDKPADVIRNVELVPFRAAINAGIKAVMVGHVIFPAFEPERMPATVSRRVITGLLREELHFKDIIVSDGMEMAGVMSLYGIEDAVRRSLNAGVDVCLVCHSPAQATAAMEFCMKALDKGEMDEAEVIARYEHQKALKAELPSLDDADPAQFGSETQKAESARIMDLAVRPLHCPDDLPLPAVDQKVVLFGAPARQQSLANDVVVLDAAREMADACGGTFVADALARRQELLTCAAGGAVMVSVLTNNDPDLQERIALTNELAEAGAKVVAVAMTTPFLLQDVTEKAWKIAVYEYDEFGLSSLMRCLKLA